MVVKTYRKHLSDPHITNVKERRKTIEGRLLKKDFIKIDVGDEVIWFNEGRDDVKTQITKIKMYKTFKEYLETEGLENCLPGVDTIEDGIEVYRKWFCEEDEQKYGVVAFGLELLR